MPKLSELFKRQPRQVEVVGLRNLQAPLDRSTIFLERIATGVERIATALEKGQQDADAIRTIDQQSDRLDELQREVSVPTTAPQRRKPKEK